MAANLLQKRWNTLDPHELRLVLDERIGGPGQVDSASGHPKRLQLPIARSDCRVALDFKDGRIRAIVPGLAFDAAEWKRVIEQIDRLLLGEPRKVGRQFSFSSYRVCGSWRGGHSGVQILPPPPNAALPPVELADHPFVLEFPVVQIPGDDFHKVNAYRSGREHQALTRLLNVLLRGHTGFVLNPQRPSDLWVIETDWGTGESTSKWLQRGYVEKLGPALAEELTPPPGERLEELTVEEYYGRHGLDGKGLRVPVDLDAMICRYQRLSANDRARFDRAAFWLDMADHQWPLAASLSFAALVSAIESMLVRGEQHRTVCSICASSISHDVPSIGASFRSFLETHAAPATEQSVRSKMYDLRSRISHGSGLMALDEGRHFVWDPPSSEERELHWELWRLTRIALRNWLAADDHT